MFERIYNRVSHQLSDALDQVVSEVFADGISAERQGQIGSFVPPFTQVENFNKTEFFINQLTFMNQQTSVEIAARHRRNDLIEWILDHLQLRLIETECQVSRRLFAGNCDRSCLQIFFRQLSARN